MKLTSPRGGEGGAEYLLWWAPWDDLGSKVFTKKDDLGTVTFEEAKNVLESTYF